MRMQNRITSTAVLLLLLGTPAFSYPQSREQRERQQRREERDKRRNQGEVQRRAQADNQRAWQQQEQRQRAEQDARERQERDRERQPREQERRENERIEQDRRRQQQLVEQRQEQERRQQAAQQQERARQQQQLERERREQERSQQERLRFEQQREEERRRQQDRELQARVRPPQGRPPGWDEGRKEGWGGADVPPGLRISEQRQRELIEHNRRQQEQFRRRFDDNLRRGKEQGHFLQKLHRLQQYRYQQEYLERQRQHRARLWSYRDYDYRRDPYFYTVANYRYLRGGRYYFTSIYGVNLIQDALNHGYSEGYYAGRADRLDGWRFDYRNCLAYRDASYGYFGLYVDSGAYNYYFREGFRRGYEDGYHSRYRYGRYAGGSYFMLDSVRSGIFIAVRFR